MQIWAANDQHQLQGVNHCPYAESEPIRCDLASSTDEFACKIQPSKANTYVGYSFEISPIDLPETMGCWPRLQASTPTLLLHHAVPHTISPCRPDSAPEDPRPFMTKLSTKDLVAHHAGKRTRTRTLNAWPRTQQPQSCPSHTHSST